MNKKVLFLALSAILFMPALAFGITIPDLLSALVNTTFYIADAAVVILWVITGVLFLSAQGAPDKLGIAKKALIAAVVGTAIVIIANSAVYLVGNALNLPID